MEVGCHVSIGRRAIPAGVSTRSSFGNRAPPSAKLSPQDPQSGSFFTLSESSSFSVSGGDGAVGEEDDVGRMAQTAIVLLDVKRLVVVAPPDVVEPPGAGVYVQSFVARNRVFFYFFSVLFFTMC